MHQDEFYSNTCFLLPYVHIHMEEVFESTKACDFYIQGFLKIFTLRNYKFETVTVNNKLKVLVSFFLPEGFPGNNVLFSALEY